MTNTAGEAEDFGYALGVRLGAGEPGRPWRVGYTYQDLESDAVLGLFSDKDFAGGGTGKWDTACGATIPPPGVTSRIAWYANQRLAEEGASKDYDPVQHELNLDW